MENRNVDLSCYYMMVTFGINSCPYSFEFIRLTLTSNTMKKIKKTNGVHLGVFSENIKEKGDEPYHGFGYLSFISDPINLAKWSQKKL